MNFMSFMVKQFSRWEKAHSSHWLLGGIFSPSSNF